MRRRRSNEVRSEGVYPRADAETNDSSRCICQPAEVKYHGELVTLTDRVITRIKRLCDNHFHLLFYAQE